MRARDAYTINSVVGHVKLCCPFTFLTMSPEEEPPNNPIESVTVPVIEEQVRIELQEEVTGNVTITKTVTTETVSAEAPYTQENVSVERIAINKYVDEALPTVRYEGDVMIVPVLQEVLVKRTLLVEELHVTKTRASTSEAKEITLRKETVNVERT